MTDTQVSTLAREMLDAFSTGKSIPVPPSAREGGCDLDAGYAVEAELVRLRRAAGRSTVGRKIGIANRAVWRALKMKTLVWASMYDDTVQHAQHGQGSISLARMRAPKIEPEIAIKLKSVPVSADPVAAMEAIEWMAFAFEIVDCPYPEWKFQPGDFMASFGLHAALLVGEPRQVRSEDAARLVEQLGSFTVKLSKNGEVVQEGGGKNVLENPALCMAEFLSALPQQRGPEPLRAGEIISTGSLTAAPPVGVGETWHVEASGLDVAPLTVTLTA
jgi:2-oxo-3-hexenedioate decarboxylase